MLHHLAYQFLKCKEKFLILQPFNCTWKRNGKQETSVVNRDLMVRGNFHFPSIHSSRELTCGTSPLKALLSAEKELFATVVLSLVMKVDDLLDNFISISRVIRARFLEISCTAVTKNLKMTLKPVTFIASPLN